MKKLDRAATVRERLKQSAGLPLPDGQGYDFCYFRRRKLTIRDDEMGVRFLLEP